MLNWIFSFLIITFLIFLITFLSPDAPDLIFKNLYSNSIETNKELNRDKTGASGDKKVIKKIKKVIIKKEKIQFNMHEQD